MGTASDSRSSYSYPYSICAFPCRYFSLMSAVISVGHRVNVGDEVYDVMSSEMEFNFLPSS